MTIRPSQFKAVLTILTLAAILVGCSSDSPARLPENVSAAIVYEEHTERWHVAAIVAGDRHHSSLRVLCLTEEGKPEEFAGHRHTGINIDASPGEYQEGESRASTSITPSEITDPESVWGREWAWKLDGQPWEGGRWSMSTHTRPANLVAANDEVEAAFFDDLQRATTAELIGSKDGTDDLRIAFDLTSLFRSPMQFAIDDCAEDVIEQRTGDYHYAYAHWTPDSERHSITLIDRDAATDPWLILGCGPKARTDEDSPVWIREAKGEVYAAATLLLTEDKSDHSHDQADTSTVESATVSWVNGDGNEGKAVWDANGSWIRPMSISDNLRFIEALRESDEMIVTVDLLGQEVIELKLHGAALFDKPIGAELDTCIREYADLNG